MKTTRFYRSTQKIIIFMFAHVVNHNLCVYFRKKSSGSNNTIDEISVNWEQNSFLWVLPEHAFETPSTSRGKSFSHSRSFFAVNQMQTSHWTIRKQQYLKWKIWESSMDSCHRIATWIAENQATSNAFHRMRLNPKSRTNSLRKYSCDR